MNIIGLNRKELDSKCEIAIEDGYFGLILESWGQRNNPDYNKALATLIERLRHRGISKLKVFLASKPVMKNIPEPFGRAIYNDDSGMFNITEGSADSVRLSLCRYQKFFNSHSKTDIASGNGNKRILIHVAEFTKSIDWEEIVTGSGLTKYQVTDEVDTLNTRVVQIFQSAIPKPKGQELPAKSVKSATVFFRDPKVVAWTLQNSAGVCESCDSPAPFNRNGGVPYLEVHHVIPLSEGGSDTPENCVALCPNCHRAVHLSHDNAARVELLYGKISRLEREKLD